MPYLRKKSTEGKFVFMRRIHKIPGSLWRMLSRKSIVSGSHLQLSPWQNLALFVVVVVVVAAEVAAC